MQHNVSENGKMQDVVLSGYLYFSHPIQGKFLNLNYIADVTKTDMLNP